VVRRQAGVVEVYLRRLVQEAKELYQRYPNPLQSLYFGGGTPSFLRNQELQQLHHVFLWPLDRTGGAEVTMEANPGTLNKERLQILKDLGVNRLSIGVQSFQDQVLKTLGRAHGRKGALRAVEMALEAGFRTSVDLILGLPEQDFRADLREAAGSGVGHLSAYTLQIEPGTPFALNEVRLDQDLEATAFLEAEQILGEAGFVRYEVSNFAKPGRESRHNSLYWHAGFWGALGPSAAGHYPYRSEGHGARGEGEKKGLGDGGWGIGKEQSGVGSKIAYSVRTTNPPLPRWLEGEAPGIEFISPHEHAREALMLGLRLREGVDIGELEHRTHLALWETLASELTRLESEELVRINGKRISANLALVHPVILRLWDALAQSTR